MMPSRLRTFLTSHIIALPLAVGVSLLLTRPASAGAGLPWEGQLDRISNSLSGPVAKGIGLIAMVICGIGIGLSEGGGGARKLLMIGLGLSIASALAPSGSHSLVRRADLFSDAHARQRRLRLARASSSH
jgi:type IV secretory pathway VirB2 component (pilin)